MITKKEKVIANKVLDILFGGQTYPSPFDVRGEPNWKLKCQQIDTYCREIIK